MSYIVNRNSPARIECLYYLMKFITEEFSLNHPFKMKDIKYDSKKNNTLNYCKILNENKLLNVKYCKYKENPLNDSGCSLTNGVDSDSTKSKEVSNTVNSLHALGFINRIKNDLYLTPLGIEFSSTNLNSKKYLDTIRKSVLNYGLFVGFLSKIHQLNSQVFDTNEITLGYPNSDEIIEYEGEKVTVSSGSEKDSNTRTKSCLLAWATSCGYIAPDNLILEENYYEKLTQIETREFILSKKRNVRKYKVVQIPKFLFNGTFIVERPLNYDNLTKNTGALRENNQEKIRALTLSIEHIIKNRRYAIVYILNRSFELKKDLDFSLFLNYLKGFPEKFIISDESFEEVMYSELDVSFIVGIPFILKSNKIHPLTGVNIDELSVGAPKDLNETLSLFNFD